MLKTLASLALCAGASAFIEPKAYVIPAGQVDGISIADRTVGLKAFDGSHVTLNNGSAYEWWYFDAVSSAADAAVVAQFIPGYAANTSVVLFNAVWPNGTTLSESIPTGDLRLTTIGDGSQGYVEDGVMTWFGSDDLSYYLVTVDAPKLGISGKITFQSTAPPHVACGPMEDGASFDITDYLQWANVVPDSKATVDFAINGTSLFFSGSGYHDQNWGATPFLPSLTEWYWGHSSVGNYSIVWFYVINADSSTNSSVYLAEDGEILISGSSGAVSPVGHNLTTPVRTDANITGWTITMADPVHGDFAFEIENVHTAEVMTDLYSRWVGFTTGGPVGHANSTGPAIAEFMANGTIVDGISQ